MMITNLKLTIFQLIKNRIINISHASYQNNDLHKLRDILLNNGYPCHLVNKLLFNSPLNQNLILLNELIKYLTLPYIIPECSKKITNICN